MEEAFIQNRNIDFEQYSLARERVELSDGQRLMIDGINNKYYSLYSTTIAYVTNILRGLLIGEKIQYELATKFGTPLEELQDISKYEAERSANWIFEDIHSHVVEHPTTRVQKVYNYSFEWKNGSWYMEDRRMDEVYEEAVNPKNGIVPKIEMDRNKKNQEHYQKIQKARAEGNYDTFIEILPAPAMWTEELKKEAVQRGYLGNDVVLIYKYQKPEKDGENPREIVEQHWLPGSTMQEEGAYEQYRELFSSLGISLDPKQKLTDLDIINASGFLDESKIRNFIDSRQEVINEDVKNDIKAYAATIARKDLIDVQAMDQLKTAAMLLRSNPDHDISDHLKNASNGMARVQFALNLFIQEKIQGITGLQTEEYQNTNGKKLTLAEFRSFKENDQLHLLEKNEFKFSGCGTTQEFKLFGSSESNGMGSVMSSGRPDAVFCEACKKNNFDGYVGNVRNGDSSTYFLKCKVGHPLDC